MSETKNFTIVSTSFLNDVSGSHQHRPRSRVTPLLPINPRGTHWKAFVPGKELLVVSTRPKLLDGDQWWIELVSKENIFLPTSCWIMTNSGKPEWTCEDFSAGWKSLYHRLGEKWASDWDGNQHWLSIRQKLIDLNYEVY